MNLNLINLSTVKRRDTEYLWEPFVPLGCISLIQGDGGTGKSWVSLAIAVAITNGNALPGNDKALLPPSNVIVQNAENDLERVITKRLDILKADDNRIFHIDPSEAKLSLIDERIEAAIIKTNARLVILDPVQGYLNGAIRMNSAESIRPAFTHLTAIAQKHNCAIILVGHFNKSRGAAQYRGLGSVDIINAVPSVMYVGYTDRESGIRAIVHGKSNYSEAGVSQAFSLSRTDGFQWHGDCNATIEDVTGGKGDSDSVGKRDTAKAFIQELIEENPNSSSKELFELVSERGVSEATYRRAREDLGLTKKQTKKKK